MQVECHCPCRQHPLPGFPHRVELKPSREPLKLTCSFKKHLTLQPKLLLNARLPLLLAARTSNGIHQHLPCGSAQRLLHGLSLSLSSRILNFAESFS